MRQRIMALLIAAGAASLTMGCPASDCGPAGTCAPGAFCRTASECASRACAPVVPGGSPECLTACDAATPCPAGRTCVDRTEGAFCVADSIVVDAGTRDAPALSDVGPVDSDSDGVSAATDCNDSDPGVGRTATRSCTSMCGAGTEACTDGTWGPCSAPTDCGCSMAGAMRVIDCGYCGMQSQRCDGATWTDTGACLYQGECTAGAAEIEDTTWCGQRQRLCDAECHWLDWVQTVPDGECESGSCRCSPFVPDERWRCSATCMRVRVAMCDDLLPCEEWP